MVVRVGISVEFVGFGNFFKYLNWGWGFICNQFLTIHSNDKLQGTMTFRAKILSYIMSKFFRNILRIKERPLKANFANIKSFGFKKVLSTKTFKKVQAKNDVWQNNRIFLTS